MSNGMGPSALIEMVAGAIWFEGYGRFRPEGENKWPDNVKGNSQTLFRSVAVAAIGAMQEAAEASPPGVAAFAPALDERWLARFSAWNLETFGPGLRTAGTLDHIRKECREIEADPSDPKEWVDIILLAINGLVRLGHSPADIISEIRTKHRVNELRRWPDWRGTDPEKAIEHHKVLDEASYAALHSMVEGHIAAFPTPQTKVEGSE